MAKFRGREVDQYLELNYRSLVHKATTYNTNPTTVPSDQGASTSPLPLRGPCTFLVLELTTDDYGIETTWKVVDTNSNSTLFIGGPYPAVENNHTFTETMCLPVGAYEFIIEDFDGICCTYGDGQYGLSIGDRVIRPMSDGVFESQEVTAFKVTEEDDTQIQATTVTSTGWSTFPTLSISQYSSTEPIDGTTVASLPTTPFSKVCYDVTIFIQTDTKTGGDAKGDTVTWELYQSGQAGEVLLNGGPYQGNKTYISSQCLTPGWYVFDITDSGGDGFLEECEDCGYGILVEDVLVGGALFFFYNEKLTFPVPFYGDEPDNDNFEFCDEDVYVVVRTDNWPQENWWDIADASGEVVLSGGPYSKAETTYTQRSCLVDADGPFNFTIYDAEGDGIKNGFYMLFVEGQNLADTSSFGASNSTIFTVGASASKL